jgi:hypothetical protein
LRLVWIHETFKYMPGNSLERSMTLPSTEAL